MSSETSSLQSKLIEVEQARADMESDHAKQMHALEARLRAEAREALLYVCGAWSGRVVTEPERALLLRVSQLQEGAKPVGARVVQASSGQLVCVRSGK